jgi:phenylalanyl-tRNA synthetase alpha chain
MDVHITHISERQLAEALALPDLTDAAYGSHCMQLLAADAIAVLGEAWNAATVVWRGERIVTLADNYDLLGYPSDGPARAARYTRCVDDARILRTQTSAAIPAALRSLAGGSPAELVLAVPGLCWRRDSIDRLHTGELHQLDLWRITTKTVTEADLDEMIDLVVGALLPLSRWRATVTEHPYTLQGREVEVKAKHGWVELLECGLAHPDVLAAAGVADRTGLALGAGLDRAVMLRKGIDDIRLLRSTDARVSRQMLDLSPYRSVSAQPPATRDMSVAAAAGTDDEELGDLVRCALDGRAREWVEEVRVLSRTPASELPRSARERIGIADGQENLLVRVRLRHPTRALSRAEANVLRDRIYAALHHGSVHQWASAAPAGSASDPTTMTAPRCG